MFVVCFIAHACTVISPPHVQHLRGTHTHTHAVTLTHCYLPPTHAAPPAAQQQPSTTTQGTSTHRGTEEPSRAPQSGPAGGSASAVPTDGNSAAEVAMDEEGQVCIKRLNVHVQ